MNLFLLSSSYKLGGVGGGNDGSRNITRRRKDKVNDDGTVLVEEQDDEVEVEVEGEGDGGTATIDEQSKNISSANNEVWQFLSITIDRLLIFILLLIYVISIFTLIPLARLATSNPIKVEN